MTSIPVPHPPFINWPVQVDLTSGGRELLTDSVTAMLTGKNKTRSDYPHLLAKMNKRCTATVATIWSLASLVSQLCSTTADF